MESMSLKDWLKQTLLAEVVRFPRRLRAAAAGASTYGNISSSGWKLFSFLITSPGSLKGRDTLRGFSYGNLGFVIGRPEWNGAREVLFDREYSFVTAALEGMEKPVVLDLGANAGTFPIYIFSMFPGAEVHSFEPGGRTYDILEKNRGLNPGYEWKTYRAAVWKEDGEIEFQNFEASTSSRIAAGGKGNETVPSASLGTILGETAGGRKIDLVKMDIEGAEEEVLAGNEQLIAERVENMVVEIHPGRCSIENVISSLRKSYPNIYFIFGRKSAWQVVFASCREYPFTEYRDEYMHAPPESAAPSHSRTPASPGREPSLKMT